MSADSSLEGDSEVKIPMLLKMLEQQYASRQQKKRKIAQEIANMSVEPQDVQKTYEVMSKESNEAQRKRGKLLEESKLTQEKAKSADEDFMEAYEEYKYVIQSIPKLETDIVKCINKKAKYQSDVMESQNRMNTVADSLKSLSLESNMLLDTAKDEDAAFKAKNERIEQDHAAMVANLRGKIAGWNSKAVEVEQAISKVETEITITDEDIRSQKAQEDEVTAELARYDEDLAELSRDLDTEKHEITIEEDTAADCEDEIGAKSESLIEVEKSMEVEEIEFVEALNALRMKLDRMFDDQRAAKDKADWFDQSIAELKLNIRSVEDAQRDLDEQKATTEAKLSCKLAEVATLEQDIRSEVDQLAEMDVKISKLENCINATDEEVEKVTAQLGKENLLVTQLQRDIESAETKGSNLDEELNAATALNNSLSSDVAQAKDQHAQLVAKRDVLKEANDAKRWKIGQRRTELEIAKHDRLQSVQDKLASLELSVKSKHREIESARVELEEVQDHNHKREAALCRERKTLLDLEKSLFAKERQISKVEKDFGDIDRVLSARMDEEKAKTRSTARSLQAKINEINTKKDAVQTEIESLEKYKFLLRNARKELEAVEKGATDVDGAVGSSKKGGASGSDARPGYTTPVNSAVKIPSDASKCAPHSSNNRKFFKTLQQEPSTWSSSTTPGVFKVPGPVLPPAWRPFNERQKKRSRKSTTDEAIWWDNDNI